jgi:hypothetical protein
MGDEVNWRDRARRRSLAGSPGPRRVRSLAATVGCVALVVTGAAVTSAGAQAAASGGSITLDNGQITIPKADVGDVNLTALPLGDNQYSSSPERGKIDLCNPGMLQPANDTTTLPWVHGSTWNLTQKAFVSGQVSWSDATFQNQVQGSTRVLSGDDLPVGETTGTFPVSPTDPAFAYRPDESHIVASNFTLRLPAMPKVASNPTCLGGDVGVTIDGVALLDGFDANGRDAGAQEVQDACQGHPNQLGYHRHAMPLCLLSKDSGTGQSRLLGYALDGFGIYGPRGAHGKVLTNADLDACHGTTSTVTWNGKRVRMYHYVFTWEFPYTVGCFRGTPVSRSIFGAQGASQSSPPPGGAAAGGQTTGGPPPGAPGPGGPGPGPS